MPWFALRCHILHGSPFLWMGCCASWKARKRSLLHFWNGIPHGNHECSAYDLPLRLMAPANIACVFLCRRLQEQGLSCSGNHTHRCEPSLKDKFTFGTFYVPSVFRVEHVTCSNICPLPPPTCDSGRGILFLHLLSQFEASAAVWGSTHTALS